MAVLRTTILLTETENSGPLDKEDRNYLFHCQNDDTNDFDGSNADDFNGIESNAGTKANADGKLYGVNVTGRSGSASGSASAGQSSEIARAYGACMVLFDAPHTRDAVSHGSRRIS